MTSIVVFDYGFGNIRSMMHAVAHQGVDVELTSDYKRSVNADGLVVPGVGAFAACMDGLKAVNGDRVIYDRLRLGRPVLGVCVGLQIMFDQGLEHTDAERHGLAAEGADGDNGHNDGSPDGSSGNSNGHVQSAAPGLGVISGTVSKLDAPVVPHMGWDTIEIPKDSSLLAGLNGQYFYFVHSYAAMEAEAPVHSFSDEIPKISWCTYGNSRFVASYEQGPLSATQFHPEKSGQAGATLLSNWIATL